MKKNVVLIVGVIMVLNSNITASSGLSLKELNQQDTTTLSVNIIAEANQTTEQNLEQAGIVANYFKRQNGFFIGASTVGVVSTEFGTVTPVLYLSAGADFNSFRLEYRVGTFQRSSIFSSGLDPQYNNYCIVLGEGAPVSEAMQLSLVRNGSRLSIGHQAANKFYGFEEGKWYASLETPVCSWLSLSGGIDYEKTTTGYAAAKVNSGANNLVVTANRLGTDKQNFIVTYSRNNIAVRDHKLTMTVSLWAKESEQGVHFVTGFSRGRATLFAELGSNITTSSSIPYVGVGTCYGF